MPATPLTLAELMSRHIVSVRMDDTLKTIRELFEANQFHHLLVVESRRLVGVISDRDLLHHVSPFVGHVLSERSQDLATLNKRAHQIMSRKLITATPQTTAADAVALILMHHISCLPIVNADSHPVGIITWRDLLRTLVPPADVEST